MTKNIIGFNSEDDFDRMSRSVRKSENTPQVGQRQRAKYPGGGGGVMVERAIITEVGSSGVHKAFLVTGGYTNDLTSPDVISNEGTTEVYTGDHIVRSIEAGDNIMVAKVTGKWWIVEVSEDCRGGCVDEPDPDGIPGYIASYKWHMPYIPCCPEASGTWKLNAVSESSDTDWESDTFQCNSDGTDRKWVYDGTKIQIEPIPGVGSIQYRHEEGNKLCPTKMYKFAGVFPDDCGEFPRVACMVPLCTGKFNTSRCGGKLRRNWMVTFDGSVSGSACTNFVSGRVYTAIFADDPTSDINGTFYQAYKNMTVELTDNKAAPFIFVHTTPSSTSNVFQLTSHVVYKVRDAGDFNCDGLTILDIDSNTSATCSGFPDTVYAFPVDDEYISSYCCPNVNEPLYSSHPGSDTDFESYWHCDNIPYNLLMEFTSVANDSCSTCDTFNKVHKLYCDGQNRYGANWRSYDTSEQTDCNGFSVDARYYINLIVTYTETPYLYIANTSGYPSGGDILYARYELTAGSLSGWSCKGENEFTLISESGYCDFPSTVTIKPCGTA